MRRFCLLALLVFSSSTCQSVSAALVTYTTASEFFGAVDNAGFVTVAVDFDGEPDDTEILSGSLFGGITFVDASTPAYPLLIRDGSGLIPPMQAISGLNFLGSDVLGLFSDSLALELAFEAPVNAFGFWVLSPDPLFEGDVVLSLGSDSVGLVQSANADDDLLSGGSTYGYFLGLSDFSQPFSSVSITSSGFFGIAFGLDNMTYTAVPEPNAWLSLAVFFVALGIARGLAPRKRDSYGLT